MSWSEKHIEKFDEWMDRRNRNGTDKPFDASDPAEKELQEDMQLLRNASRVQDLEEKMALLKELGNARTGQRTAVTRRLWMRRVSAAAAVLLLVAAGWWMTRPTDTQRMLAEYTLPPIDNVVGVRGDADQLTKAMQAYDTGDFAEASSLFRQVDLTNQEPVYQLYFGHSLITEEQCSAGIASLENYLAGSDLQFADEAWFLVALGAKCVGDAEKFDEAVREVNLELQSRLNRINNAF